MAEVRCPMCSKLNDAEAEICAFCQARIRPLVIDPVPDEDDGGERKQEEAREDTVEDGEEEVPDWLARIRDRESAEEGAEEETPAAPEEEDEDWLERLRTGGELEGEMPEDSELLSRFESVARGEEDKTEPEPEEEPEPTPGWLGRLREAEAIGEEGPPEGPIPEWLDEMAEAVPEDMQAVPEEEPPSPAEEEPWEVEPPAEPPSPAEEEPWEVEPPAEPPSPAEEEPREVELPAEPIEVPPSEEPEEEAPLESVLPHVPALVPEGELKRMGEDEPEISLEKLDLPDWVEELKPPDSAETPPELARARLPSWLESMRPIESIQPIEEGELETGEPAETVGPLAGLLGVLSAEPVVAMPRTPTAGAGMLEVSDRQFAQSEVLKRLIAEEQREAAVKRPLRVGARITRALIGLILFAAVAVSVTLGAVIFSPPIRVSRDLIDFVGLVNDLPQDRPVLLVFDYEPAFTGELEAIAGAMLDHMVERELPLVTLSTRPSGPPLAERMISPHASESDLEFGEDYAHLGYLAGGEAAVQLFAASPSQAVLYGFMLPEGFQGRSLWETALLGDVERLSDFGMVAVITARPEIARLWAEQAHPWIGDTPLAMVLSTGADPLVRPYYETRDPWVDGLLSGLPAAMAYEQINGQPSQASARWNGFGVGVLVVEIMLATGVVMGLVPGLIRRKAGRSGNA
ncbi:MAG: hypothetical protein PVJ07_03495 [Anaerolineales bacterium]